jgi:hypothetical protein
MKAILSGSVKILCRTLKRNLKFKIKEKFATSYCFDEMLMQFI